MTRLETDRRRPAPRHRGLGATVAFVALWGGLLVGMPSRGNSGAAIVVFAVLLGASVLPIEYAAVAATVPALLPALFGGLPEWYMGTFRWLFIFAGLAILVVRCVTLPASRGPRRWSPFQPLVGSFVAVAALSGLISVTPSLSLLKWCVLVAALAGSAIAGTKVVQTYRGAAARNWVRAWIACFSPILVVNVIAVLTGLGGGVYVQGGFRGLSGNANSLAAVLAVILPLFVCQFIYAKRKPDSRTWLLALLTMSAGFLLALSWSRASIAAGAVSLLVFWWIHPRNQLTRYAALVGVLALWFVIFSPRFGDQVENWVYKGKTTDTLLQARAGQWRRGIEAFQRSPLLGEGFGITSRREESWALDSFEGLKKEQGSSLFAILGQTGLLGTIPLYAAILILLFSATRFARAVKDPWLSGVVSSSWAAFLNSFFEGWLAAPSSGLFWFFIFQLFFLSAIITHLRAPQRAGFRPLPVFAGAAPVPRSAAQIPVS